MVRLSERAKLVLAVPKIISPTPPIEDDARVYTWLSCRGITRDAANGIVYDPQADAIGFPYLENGTPSAIKWRCLPEKKFWQTGVAATLWRVERLKKGDDLVICEGELDALALCQAGVPAVSVPNGAPQTVSDNRSSPKEDGKYRYLAASKELIEAAPKIVLATDADGPGEALSEEIARRVGRAKCWRVHWPAGCKDANDTLIKHGPDILKDCVNDAEPWPVKGLYDASHFFDKVDALYEVGFPKGKSTGFSNVDELYTVAPGQLTVVTGSPGAGKSTFLDNIMVSLAKKEGWRFAVCSFENPPEIHIAKLAAIVARLPFFKGPTPRMDREACNKALAWVREHFIFLYQADGSLSSLDEIVDLTKSAVLRYGVRGLVIDPYNYLDRGDSNETEWVSSALTKLRLLGSAHDLHIWLAAHPTKMRRRDDGTFPTPTGWDIAGSAHFSNKADMGLTVHRPDLLESKTEISTWKVRFSFHGKLGKADLTFDPPTGLYFAPVR